MIAFVEGKLEYKEASFVIINVNGIGYQLRIPLSTYSALGNEENCRLLTYYHITDDAHTLFGFKSSAEKSIFLKLISVSKVGPTLGLAALSTLSPREISQAIATEDVKTIQGIKGLGLKTAQRLILELKDKILKEGWGEEGSEENYSPRNSITDEALTALTTLGFVKATAEKSIERILRKDPSISLEELIRQALKTTV